MDVISEVELLGGTTKTVKRLVLRDGSTCVSYVWDKTYWPQQRSDDLFAHASGADLFVHAHAELVAAGVRVPEIIERRGDTILVEDISGGSLDQPALARLGSMVRAMHERRSDRFGRQGLQPDSLVEDIIVRRAFSHLSDAAHQVEEIAAVRYELANELTSRRAAVRARAEYGLIHAELGPDHVLATASGEPVLIDIEGAMYFDIEWEHDVLALRFGPDYSHFQTDGLDIDRLRLYRLALTLSLIAGPMSLVGTDFPGQDAMQDIAEQNVTRTLAEIGR
ncbi:aminoglycoside phosphotransferase [Kibdelosporangium philippinense]|uniref:Aminoglycoside phosphotransferase n=1 Tax=Kibdelosporangium philippinense TaxID=211113 RepID=A0ABS8ZJI7_9PSEU|nr:aminoglycoside phosphotransferase [Kibdelosporangium philippinense]MCE7006633.1 aminoglycoside phosphotransferase [Kibdelosporangium philippinense]